MWRTKRWKRHKALVLRLFQLVVLCRIPIIPFFHLLAYDSFCCSSSPVAFGYSSFVLVFFFFFWLFCFAFSLIDSSVPFAAYQHLRYSFLPCSNSISTSIPIVICSFSFHKFILFKILCAFEAIRYLFSWSRCVFSLLFRSHIRCTQAHILVVSYIIPMSLGVPLNRQFLTTHLVCPFRLLFDYFD